MKPKPPKRSDAEVKSMQASLVVPYMALGEDTATATEVKFEISSDSCEFNHV